MSARVYRSRSEPNVDWSISLIATGEAGPGAKFTREGLDPWGGTFRFLCREEARRGGRYVFAPRGGRPIAVNSLTHALRRNGHLGLEHFTAHDLRRTASDWLARMGIDGRSRSAVLNHKEAGTTKRHYTVYTFDVEKRVALQRWENELRGILEDRPSEKVVSIG